MTTKVIGIQWTPEGSRLVPVDDNLNYAGGWAGGFNIYELHPKHLGGNVIATDGPKAALLRWEGGTKVIVDGQVECPPEVNYQLREGSTLVAQGPIVDGQQAELTITFTPSGSPERPF